MAVVPAITLIPLTVATPGVLLVGRKKKGGQEEIFLEGEMIGGCLIETEGEIEVGGTETTGDPRMIVMFGE